MSRIIKFQTVHAFANSCKLNLCSRTNKVTQCRSFTISIRDFSRLDFHALQHLEFKSNDSVIDKAYIQNELARRLHSGDGVEVNLENAVSYVKKAAENGLASAQFNFAGMLFTGVGVERDPVRGLDWYRRCATNISVSESRKLKP
jgi:TPR repeat protein